MNPTLSLTAANYSNLKIPPSMTVIHDQISATESYFSSLEKMLIFHFLFQSFSIKIYLILKEKCLQPTKISLTRS